MQSETLEPVFTGREQATGDELRSRGDVSVSQPICAQRVHGRTVHCRGAIVGGHVTALESITCREAGNTDGIATVLAVNVDLWRQLDLADTQSRIAALEGGLNALRANLEAMAALRGGMKPESARRYEALSRHAQRMEMELGLLRARVPELASPEVASHGVIEVEDGIHAGVVLKIGPYERAVAEHFPGRRRVYLDRHSGEIVIAA